MSLILLSTQFSQFTITCVPHDKNKPLQTKCNKGAKPYGNFTIRHTSSKLHPVFFLAISSIVSDSFKILIAEEIDSRHTNQSK